MTPEITRQIADLHAAYKALTGLDISLDHFNMARDRAWFEFLRAGFTKADLELTIRYLRGRIKSRERNDGCLRFNNLIRDLERFEEDLAFAKAARPVPKLTEQQKVLAQFRGEPVPEANGGKMRPAGEAVEAALRELLKMRDGLK